MVTNKGLHARFSSTRFSLVLATFNVAFDSTTVFLLKQWYSWQPRQTAGLTIAWMPLPHYTATD